MGRGPGSCIFSKQCHHGAGVYSCVKKAWSLRRDGVRPFPYLKHSPVIELLHLALFLVLSFSSSHSTSLILNWPFSGKNPQHAMHMATVRRFKKRKLCDTRFGFSWIKKREWTYIPFPLVPSHCSKGRHFAQKAKECIHTFPSNHLWASSCLLLLALTNPPNFGQILCALQIKWQHLDEILLQPSTTVQYKYCSLESKLIGQNWPVFQD